MGHTFSKHVHGFHCDAYGHVNNARYLEFLEEARWEALSAFDLIKKFKQLHLQFFVVNINIDFKKPVMPGHEIEINTKLGVVKRKTMSFVQTISASGQLKTQAEITFVLYNAKTQSASTLTEEMVQLFKDFTDA